MLQRMTDDEFDRYSDKLVRTERKITRRVLEMINECIRRRYYAKADCDSIFVWLTKCRGYSNPAADRRLKAAALLRVVPEVAKKIDRAEVNLTTLAQLQQTIRKEEKRTGKKVAAQHKRELISMIEDQTSNETAKLLATEFPEAVVASERITPVNADLSKSTMYLTNAQKAKLERAREVLSHSHFNATNAEIIEVALDFLLDAKDPLRAKPKDARRQKKADAIVESKEVDRSRTAAMAKEFADTPKSRTASTPVKAEPSAKAEFKVTGAEPSDTPPAAEHNPWYLDEAYCRTVTSVAEMKRIVLLRADGRCVYKNKRTGESCASRHQVQVDHIQPKGLGGRDEIANFRPLCRTHNLLMAEIVFGSAKIAPYRRSQSLH